MRESTLYQETKCGHGYMEEHFSCNEITGPEYDAIHHTNEDCECIGGKREKFIPDRNAAIKVFRNAGYNNKGLQILLDQAIDASLGIVEPF